MKKKFITILTILIVIVGIKAQKKMTSFKPEKHGFKFRNSFKVSFGDKGSIKADWGGLCGGMTFSAADYFYSSLDIPSQKYPPANGTELYQYLYDRQQSALWNASIDKSAENWFNPFGSRNEEFWGWAVDERLKQIKTFIDKDKPIPILLFNGLSNDVAKNHWVLAIGYDLASYTFKKKKDLNVEKVKIFVYDPNYPNKICVISPKIGGDWLLDYDIWNTNNEYGRNLDMKNRRWRHYYVYNEFSSKNPPIIITEPDTNSEDLYMIVAQLKTGGDDLRGGDDNVNITIEYTNGEIENFKNVNNSKRWPDWSTNNIELRLRKGLKPTQIKCFEVSTTFRGGFGGDNWNLQSLIITGYKKNGKTLELKTVKGKPWKRFTGDSKRKKLLLDNS